ncbi:uncharacterized protein LOC132062454 [Lycium ferocissimum]|uniref:uncharacterized protein LOC132062454 n=1 Tax=Lycium ferocissimum TaxID=112874 RepID=UPI00281679E5|nr:uncharacterized protein LOC132062454 [Lycium ferocissimum]
MYYVNFWLYLYQVCIMSIFGSTYIYIKCQHTHPDEVGFCFFFNHIIHFSSNHLPKMSTRSTGYSTNEDMLLCQVYLDVSQDPITGVHQSF